MNTQMQSFLPDRVEIRYWENGQSIRFSGHVAAIKSQFLVQHCPIPIDSEIYVNKQWASIDRVTEIIPYRQLFKKAWDLFLANSPSKAMIYLHRILEFSSGLATEESSAANFLLGYIAQVENSPKALEYYTSALSGSSHVQAAALSNIGVYYAVQSGDVAIAEDYFNQAITIKPKFFPALVNQQRLRKMMVNISSPPLPGYSDWTSLLKNADKELSSIPNQIVQRYLSDQFPNFKCLETVPACIDDFQAEIKIRSSDLYYGAALELIMEAMHQIRSKQYDIAIRLLKSSSHKSSSIRPLADKLLARITHVNAMDRHTNSAKKYTDTISHFIQTLKEKNWEVAEEYLQLLQTIDDVSEEEILDLQKVLENAKTAYYTKQATMCSKTKRAARSWVLASVNAPSEKKAPFRALASMVFNRFLRKMSRLYLEQGDFKKGNKIAETIYHTVGTKGNPGKASEIEEQLAHFEKNETPEEREIDLLKDQIKLHIDKKDFTGARNLLEDTWVKYPTDHDFIWAQKQVYIAETIWAGQEYMKSNEWQKGRDQFIEVLTLEPQNEVALQCLLEVELKANGMQGADYFNSFEKGQMAIVALTTNDFKSLSKSMPSKDSPMKNYHFYKHIKDQYEKARQ